MSLLTASVYCNDKGFPTLHASRFDRILVVIVYTTLLVVFNYLKTKIT